jgi:hypothetical protein
LGIKSNPRVESEDSDSTEELESGEALTPRSVRRGQGDPDWEPSSVYLQRKLRADSSPKEVAYQLRTRPVYKPESEVQECNRRTSATQSLENRETVLDTQSVGPVEPSNQTTLPTNPSYNLRRRI